MNQRASASGLVLLLLIAGLFAVELVRPQSPFELSGEATRSTRSGTRSSLPPTLAQPRLVLERPPNCNDRLKNGAETDVDCGGSACPPCAVGKSCIASTDCSSSVCQSGACHVPPPPAPTCSDALKNAQETAVDCGGPTCPKCELGASCASSSDCNSNLCQNSQCSAPCIPTWGPYGLCSVTACGLTGTKSRSDGCGNTETVSCSTPACCVPQWRNDGACTAPCGQTGNYQRQIDGCGNSRMTLCSGQACPKSGYCGWCGADSNCQSGFCYHGYCINRGDQVGGWGNPGIIQRCYEGSYCEAWSSKPIRLVEVQFTCNPSATPYSSTAEAVAYYKGNRVWSQTKECTNINVDPWRGVLPTYISWAPGSLGWVDKLVTYNQGTAIATNAEVLPCVI